MITRELTTDKFLIKSDDLLLSVLKNTLVNHRKFKPYRNESIDKLSKDLPKKSSFYRLRNLLSKMGTFEFHQETHPWQDIDKQKRQVTLVRATKIPVWPMGTNIFLRDNILIADRLLRYDSKSDKRSKLYNKLGAELLHTCITIISSKSQINRFLSVIKSSSKKYRDNPLNWPQVFLRIDNNLNGSHSNPWSHKQDSWQMIGYHITSRLSQGILKPSFLNEKNKCFLGALVPFFIKTDHIKQENSGSWEEVPSRRTSVLSWEVILINQLLELSKNKNFSFLSNQYKILQRYLPSPFNKLNYSDTCSKLIENGAKEILLRVPDEAPNYNKSDPRFRTSDAALIYLLQLDIPKLITKWLNLTSSIRDKLEESILQSILTLYDDEVGGFKRYHGDSYQRQGFFRFETTFNLKRKFGALSGDVSNQMKLRDQIVPKGREALWTHPTWQLSAWAGRRFLQTNKKRYAVLQHKMFIAGLRMITGRDEATIRENGSGKIGVSKIESYRIPECYLTEQNNSKDVIVYPSTHTPLYWSIAEALDAFNIYEKTI